jgi:hypothetical protein
LIAGGSDPSFDALPGDKTGTSQPESFKLIPIFVDNIFNLKLFMKWCLNLEADRC